MLNGEMASRLMACYQSRLAQMRMDEQVVAEVKPCVATDRSANVMAPEVAVYRS